jgi:hypothetical protein
VAGYLGNGTYRLRRFFQVCLCDLDRFEYGSWTQPYSVTITEKPKNGTILGWSFARDLKDCVNNKDRDATYVDDSAVNASNSSSTTFYFLTAYSREGLKEGTILSNSATGTLTGVDGATGTKSDGDAYTYKEYIFKYAGDEYSINKSEYGDSLSPNGAGFLNKLDSIKDGDPVGPIYSTRNYDFSITSKTRGWALTVPDGTASPKYEDYGKDPYTVEVTDDQVILNGETLTAKDYSITTAFFGLQEYNCVQSSYSGTYYETEDDQYSQWEPITLQYRIGKGNWQTLGEVTTKNTSTFTFKYADGRGTVDVGIYNLLSLPSGTTQVRLVHDTKYYYCVMRLYLQVSLNNTEHVRSLVKDLKTVDFNNVASLRVLDEDDNWVNKKTYGVSGSIANNIKDYDSALYGDGIYAQHGIATVTFSRLAVDSSINKKVKYDNSANTSMVTANYTVEEMSFVRGSMTYDEYKASGVLDEQRTGVFYDLLPSGMSVDQKTIQVRPMGRKSYAITRSS